MDQPLDHLPPIGSTRRVELGDGDWIDITTRPTHARVNRLYKAWERNKLDAAAYLDVQAEVILALATGWSCKAEDGHEAALTAEGLASVPFDKTMTAFNAAKDVSEEIFKGLGPNA